jgi:hypothetical protein
MPALFYKKYWKIVGKNITAEVLNGGIYHKAGMRLVLY